MRTPWIPEARLERALARNEAFWRGPLEEGPLMWVSAADARPGRVVPEPATDEALWTDVDYVIEAAEAGLARRHYAGDALPVYTPWLGPDQFAAWLGAEMTLLPRQNTSWVKPLVGRWEDHPELAIDPDNRWWRLYMDILRRSAEAGRDKWITGYPDLHTGIDALSALRGPENLSLDLLMSPEPVARAMRQMTGLWKEIIDAVDAVILPAGQGTSNWTMGWSARRFVCIGQNDFTCMIGPEMFDRFCQEDTRETADYADSTLYHLDGPGAIRHLPALLAIPSLTAIQWIQGAGAPLPSRWLDLLKSIQAAGKGVQLYYGGAHGGDADLRGEIDILCRELDPSRLFFWIETDSAAEADAIVDYAHRVAAERTSRSRR